MLQKVENSKNYGQCNIVANFELNINGSLILITIPLKNLKLDESRIHKFDFTTNYKLNLKNINFDEKKDFKDHKDIKNPLPKHLEIKLEKIKSKLSDLYERNTNLPNNNQLDQNSFFLNKDKIKYKSQTLESELKMYTEKVVEEIIYLSKVKVGLNKIYNDNVIKKDDSVDNLWKNRESQKILTNISVNKNASKSQSHYISEKYLREIEEILQKNKIIRVNSELLNPKLVFGSK
ncbi:MAG: hypothetical protein MHPSP_001940, partial [Paramarteilia canceri]